MVARAMAKPNGAVGPHVNDVVLDEIENTARVAAGVRESNTSAASTSVIDDESGNGEEHGGEDDKRAGPSKDNNSQYVMQHVIQDLIKQVEQLKNELAVI